MLELYIEDTLVQSNKELEISLTYDNFDLSNPAAVKNEYSKTVNIPGTPANNKLFGHIFKAQRVNNYLGVGLLGASFNPNKRAMFTIISNGDIFSQGYIKLDSINCNRGNITYKCTLYGGLGNFFYDLMYDDAGESRTLASLYYGINGMSPDDENKKHILEFNKQFVKQCWDNRMNDDVYDNDATKMFCPVPLYGGYYNNFESNKTLINKLAYPQALSGNRSHFLIDDIDYYDKDNWILCDSDTELSEWEIKDIRSHYQHLGVRIESIYNAIKNPDNNGGFIVDDTNVNDIEKQYIKNAYLVLDRFNYEEIDQTASIIEFTDFTHDVTNTYNRDIKAQVSLREVNLPDMTDWLNINGQLVINPEFRFDTRYYASPAIKENPFATTWVNGYKSKAAAYPWVTDSVNGGAKGYATLRSCYQYYWAEMVDQYNHVIFTSPAYMIGCKKSNVGCEELGSFDRPTSVLGKAFSSLKTMFENEINTRKHGNGDVIWTYESNLWQFKSTTSDTSLNPNDVVYDYETLVLTGDKNNPTGETKTFVIDLNGMIDSRVKKIVLKCSTIAYVGALNVTSGELSITPTKQKSGAFKQFTWQGGFYNAKLNGDWKQTNGVWFGISCASFINFRVDDSYIGVYPIDYLEGKSTVGSKVFAGDNPDADDSHVLTKNNILGTTSSPYDYIASLVKLFNWKIEKDRFDNIIRIYSHNRYYNKRIININNNIDYSDYSIIPTTSEYSIYNYNIPLVEDTYASDLFATKYGYEYNVMPLVTGYEFNKESKDVFEDLSFSLLVPWQLNSIFFNDENPNYDRRITPFMGAKYKITLWGGTDDEAKEEEAKFNGHLFFGKLSTNKYDVMPRLCAFDKEYGSVTMDNVIVLYDNYTTNMQKERNYYISDNQPFMKQLNNNNCYVRALDREVILDIMSRRVGQAAINVKKIPVFSNHFYDTTTKTFYWLNFKVSNNDLTYNHGTNVSLYDLCFKNYVEDVFNENSKITTLKVNLKQHPIDAMKCFYSFDNAVWAMNKITDFKPGRENYTKCSFIKIENIANYS